MVAFILGITLTSHLAHLAIAALVGFGIGRVKNSGKLAAVKAELTKVEGSAVAEVKTLAAAIKAKL